MEEEVWRDVVGHEGAYEVSNLGRIKSLQRIVGRCDGFSQPLKEKILKTPPNSDGYPTILLNKNGTRKSIKVHQLVAMAFLNHIPDGNKIVVDHINGIKTDNRIENLRIVTQRFNCTVGHRINEGRLSSKYVGVGWSKGKKKWRAYIKINGKMKHLGYFINELDASEAYQNDLSKLS